MECLRALLVICARLLLLTGCGLGEGHVAPVYAKWSVAVVFVVKLNGFGRFYFKNLSGVLGASGWLLGASWVPPG